MIVNKLRRWHHYHHTPVFGRSRSNILFVFKKEREPLGRELAWSKMDHFYTEIRLPPFIVVCAIAPASPPSIVRLFVYPYCICPPTLLRNTRIILSRHEHETHLLTISPWCFAVLPSHARLSQLEVKCLQLDRILGVRKLEDYSGQGCFKHKIC